MRKGFNWLGLIVLATCLLVFIALVIYCILLESPTCYAIVVIYGFVIACFTYPILYFTRKISSKPITEKAMLITKTVKTKKYYDEIGCETQKPLYFLTFQFFDNVTAEFHVKKDDFDSVTENTIGLLTYKKYRKQYYYIDFSINS